MTEHDRGAYTPQTDAAPLAFDARAPRQRRPLPITLILSVLILLALIVALVLIYRSGVRQEGQPPQPVGEPVGAVREAPPVEAQPEDPAASLNVYTDEGPTAPTTGPAFVPPPEQPLARPTAPPAAAPAPAPVTPRPTAAAPPPTSRPAAPPATAPATPARPTTVTPAPTTPAPRPTPPAPAPTASAPAPAASGGGSASVQIGAFNTREQAQAAASAVAGGRGTRVQEVQVGGSTLYRALVTGFADKAAAQAFCRTTGSSCIVR